MSLTAVVVTGHYTRPDGEPAQGTVIFKRTTVTVDSDDDIIVRPRVNVRLRDGLLKADDTGTALTLYAGEYEVTERIIGAASVVYTITVPTSGPVDIADLINEVPTITGGYAVGYSRTRF